MIEQMVRNVLTFNKEVGAHKMEVLTAGMDFLRVIFGVPGQFGCTTGGY